MKRMIKNFKRIAVIMSVVMISTMMGCSGKKEVKSNNTTIEKTTVLSSFSEESN